MHVKVLNLNFELQYMTLRTLPYSTTCPTRTTKVYPGGVRVYLYNQIVYCLETVIELLPSPCSTRCLCLRPPKSQAVAIPYFLYHPHLPTKCSTWNCDPSQYQAQPLNERFKLRIGQPIWRFVQRR